MITTSGAKPSVRPIMRRKSPTFSACSASVKPIWLWLPERRVSGLQGDEFQLGGNRQVGFAPQVFHPLPEAQRQIGFAQHNAQGCGGQQHLAERSQQQVVAGNVLQVGEQAFAPTCPQSCWCLSATASSAGTSRTRCSGVTGTGQSLVTVLSSSPCQFIGRLKNAAAPSVSICGLSSSRWRRMPSSRSSMQNTTCACGRCSRLPHAPRPWLFTTALKICSR